MMIKVAQNTTFKQSPEDSSKLATQDKISVAAGKSFKVHSWKLINNHLKIAFLSESLGSPARNTWYVFAPHVQLVDERGKRVVLKPPLPAVTKPASHLPERKVLGIAHKSQLDNALNPTGACNVTCFAMAMTYLQVRRRSTFGQFEDELYQYMQAHRLSRHDPGDLAKLASGYGVQDHLTLRGSLQDIRKAIAEGRPCIVHGYFTSFGHIIVIRGYDKNGFFVNDPYGEWTSAGYRTDLSGQNLYYSNALIKSKCSPEGENYIWLHRLAKRKLA